MKEETVENKVPSQETPVEVNQKAIFDLECQALWEKEVRTSLIFNRKLLICKPPCFSFYYTIDKHDHPTQDSMCALTLLKMQGVTDSTKFKQVLWKEAEAYRKQGHFSKLPTLSQKHFDTHENQPQNYAEEELRWAYQRIKELEDRLADQEKKTEDLTHGVHFLSQENQELMREVAKLKYKVSEDRRNIERMAKQILSTIIEPNLSQEELT